MEFLGHYLLGIGSAAAVAKGMEKFNFDFNLLYSIDHLCEWNEWLKVTTHSSFHFYSKTHLAHAAIIENVVGTDVIVPLARIRSIEILVAKPIVHNVC